MSVSLINARSTCISLVIIVNFLDDIAWDWVNERLYWTDRCLSDIEVYDPTTEYRRTLFNSTAGIRNPHGIVVDPTSGYSKLMIGMDLSN